MKEVMSIVIPVYNRAVELPRTVASVVAQDYRPLHLILVDNNSSDHSLAVCHELQAQYQDNSLSIDVMQQPKAGASAARNKGLEQVKSRYMMFFDSDDELHPDSVSRYMQAFAQHPDADIIGATIEFHNGEHSLGIAKAIFTDEPEAQVIHCILSTERFAARTQLIRDVGGWHEEYNGWEDWNLGIRLLLHTSRIYWLDKAPVSTAYLHSNTLTARTHIDGYKHFYRAVRQSIADVRHSSHPRKLRIERLVIYRQILLSAHILQQARLQHNHELLQLSRNIFNEAMNEENTTLCMRGLFHFCRTYASRGGRGCGTLAMWLIQ